MAITAARYDMRIQDNATWEDAFQLGTVGDTTWSFTGQNFRCDVKGSRDDASPLLTAQTSNGTIVVDDAVARVLHFFVPETSIAAALLPGDYVYDLVMFDGSTPPIRVVLMRGRIKVSHGITVG